MRYITIVLLFGLAPLLAQKSVPLPELQTQVRKNIFEGIGFIIFLKDCYTISLDSVGPGVLKNKMASSDLYASPDSFVRIANDTLQFKVAANTYLFKTKDNSQTLYIEEFQNMRQLMDKWRIIQPMQQVYWGYGSYYFKFDTLYPASLNVMFKTKRHIITMQKTFPFKARNYDDLSKEQWLMIDQANTGIITMLQKISETLSTDADKIYAPTNGRLYHKPLTPAERQAGFVQFWTEVKYNFAFFRQVPALNWDAVLLEYLPKFAREQSTFEYYTLLSEVCAKLKDGHTNVYFPIDTKKETYSPNVELRAFDDGVFVVNSTQLYSRLLPLGSKIVAIAGEPTAVYLKERLFPYISASTPHIKTNIALQTLFDIPAEKKLQIDYVTPQGKQKNYVFAPEQDTTSWIREDPQSGLLDFEMLHDTIAYLKINSFETEQVIPEFLKIKDSIVLARKLIIDVRENTGGNSGYGYEILKYFSPKPFLTSKWMTREHKAAYKAWGERLTEPPADPFEEECFSTFKGDYWYVAPPDTIEPYSDQFIPVPIVILFGNNTASAAEDFLVAAEQIGLAETVGDLTFGSTGQPLQIRLPGGGSARICTKKDTYPDGKEFVGYGIQPKYTVKPSLKDVLERRDIVLEFALALKPK